MISGELQSKKRILSPIGSFRGVLSVKRWTKGGGVRNWDLPADARYSGDGLSKGTLDLPNY